MYIYVYCKWKVNQQPRTPESYDASKEFCSMFRSSLIRMYDRFISRGLCGDALASRNRMRFARTCVSRDACVFVQQHLRHPGTRYKANKYGSLFFFLSLFASRSLRERFIKISRRYRKRSWRAVCYATSAPTPAFV